MSGKKSNHLPKRKRNGEGTIYQNSKTLKWVAQLNINGKRKTVATGEDYEEVKAKLDKAKVELREGSYIDKNNITIRQILEQNLQNQEHSNKICPSTMLRNRETAKVIFKSDFANMSIQKVHRQDIQDFLNNVADNYSNSYIDKIHIQVSNIFKVATMDKLINENPFAIGAITKPKSVKPDKKVDALTIEEHRAFLEQLRSKNYKYKDVFYVLFETGMRVRRSISITA